MICINFELRKRETTLTDSLAKSKEPKRRAKEFFDRLLNACESVIPSEWNYEDLLKSSFGQNLLIGRSFLESLAWESLEKDGKRFAIGKSTNGLS